jgi:cytochrome c oxidase cbb3-type subunit 3
VRASLSVVSGVRPGLAALATLLTLASLLTQAACDRPPSRSDLRDWSATDHGGEQRGAPTPGAKQGARSSSDAGGPDILVEVTWQKQCSTCHGPAGKGDGPEGPMVKAQDLTREDWQAKIDDAQMASSIRNGKGRMPKFDKVPDEVVAGLVKRIRSLRGR